MVIALILTGASGVSILLRGTYGSVSSAAQERGEDGMGWEEARKWKEKSVESRRGVL